MEPQPLRLLGLGAVDVAHPARPDPAGRAELGDLLEEVDVRVEEERQPGGEDVDVEAAGEAELDVAEPVGQREGELLRGRRAGLADVVAGDRERLVRRDLLGAVLHQVADQAQVRLGAEQPLLLGDVLLEDVGLQGAVEQARVDAGPLGGDDHHAEDRHGRAADRHRRGDRRRGRCPSKSRSMSAAESMATPQWPTSPSALRSSESRPIRVGMSKATLSPPPPRPRIIR